MEHRNSNPSIACTVTSCAYHCKDQNHCSLNEIDLGDSIICCHFSCASSIARRQAS